MTCQSVRETFPELLDHRTAATAHLEARAHLASCPDCQREYAALNQTATALDALPTPSPSPRLRQNFHAMLEEEKRTAAGVRAVAERSPHPRGAWLRRWLLGPLLACSLLAIGFILGQRAIPAATAPVPADNAMQREVVALRDQMNLQREQLNKMTTLVGYSILQQQQNPANTRLRDVLASAQTENPSDKVLDDLVSALTLDPSANVRLRAVEALYPHAEHMLVRAGVLAALPREQNPLVQLELIDFVAAAQDRNAMPVLEKISADKASDRAVRDAAKRALAQL